MVGTASVLLTVLVSLVGFFTTIGNFSMLEISSIACKGPE